MGFGRGVKGYKFKTADTANPVYYMAGRTRTSARKRISAKYRKSAKYVGKW